MSPAKSNAGFTRLRCGLRRGFTLPELLIVLAIFAMTASVTLPFLASFAQRKTLSIHGRDVVQVLRRAQHRSISGERDSAWGVKFLSGSYLLFAGNSYATRDFAFDEPHTVATSYTFTGLPEVDFQKVTGKPAVAGSVVIEHAVAGTSIIDIGAGGSIHLR